MRAYELVYALRPNLPDDDRNANLKRIEELAKRLGCSHIDVEEWGIKRTAYELRGFREAYYVVTRFLGEPSARDEIDRQLGLSDDVLRHLFIRLDEIEKSTDEGMEVVETEEDMSG